jgi:hypothetical protein
MAKGKKTKKSPVVEEEVPEKAITPPVNIRYVSSPIPYTVFL